MGFLFNAKAHIEKWAEPNCGRVWTTRSLTKPSVAYRVQLHSPLMLESHSREIETSISILSQKSPFSVDRALNRWKCWVASPLNAFARSVKLCVSFLRFSFLHFSISPPFCGHFSFPMVFLQASRSFSTALNYVSWRFGFIVIWIRLPSMYCIRNLIWFSSFVRFCKLNREFSECSILMVQIIVQTFLGNSTMRTRRRLVVHIISNYWTALVLFQFEWRRLDSRSTSPSS